MSFKVRLNASKSDILSFCRKYHIKKLAIFGSALRDELGPESGFENSQRPQPVFSP
jgi:hypothetical protein